MSKNNNIYNFAACARKLRKTELLYLGEKGRIQRFNSDNAIMYASNNGVFNAYLIANFSPDRQSDENNNVHYVFRPQQLKSYWNNLASKAGFNFAKEETFIFNPQRRGYYQHQGNKGQNQHQEGVKFSFYPKSLRTLVCTFDRQNPNESQAMFANIPLLLHRFPLEERSESMCLGALEQVAENHFYRKHTIDAVPADIQRRNRTIIDGLFKTDFSRSFEV